MCLFRNGGLTYHDHASVMYSFRTILMVHDESDVRFDL